MTFILKNPVHHIVFMGFLEAGVCSPAGIGKKERLVIEEEEGAGGEEEVNRRNMDISLLREQYRSTRERQRRHTQVLLFRKGEQNRAAGLPVESQARGGEKVR